MALSTESVELDSLDIKLTQAFPGRVVRKDLVRNIKGGLTFQCMFWNTYWANTAPRLIRRSSQKAWR